MAETMLIASAIAGGVQAGTSVLGIFQERSAAELEIQQLEEEKAAAELRGLQEENIRTKKLNEVLSTQEAIRAGHGLSFSPTGENIRNFSISEAEKDIRTIRLDTERAVSKADYGIANAGARKTNAIFKGISGVVSGVSTAATGVDKYAMRSSTKVK